VTEGVAERKIILMNIRVFVVVEEVKLKPRIRLPETMEKLGLQCDVSVKVLCGK